jgi:3-methyladenine DNA glycosylase AlkD
MKNEIIENIRKDLKNNIDKHTLEICQSFFKEKIKFYGVKSAIVNKIGSENFSHIKKESKEVIFSLCEELLKSDYAEEAYIAFDWAYRINKDYQKEDFIIFEKWVNKYVNSWAKCDTLCNHAIGSFIEKYPEYIENLKIWTKSPNRWVRRASAVTLIIPARKGKFLKDIFEISDKLLIDKDDLVQKGYGWMLKEASKAYQNEVFEYVMRNKVIMPRTALRYSIEKMPDELRKQAMKK